MILLDDRQLQPKSVLIRLLRQTCPQQLFPESRIANRSSVEGVHGISAHSFSKQVAHHDSAIEQTLSFFVPAATNSTRSSRTAQRLTQ